jgi:hypothetical protein
MVGKPAADIPEELLGLAVAAVLLVGFGVCSVRKQTAVNFGSDRYLKPLRGYSTQSASNNFKCCCLINTSGSGHG